MEDTSYLISDIASHTGLSIDVIRYYEKIGVLPPISRKENGHRIYSRSDLERIMFVTHLKRTQMPLKDIEQYVRFYNEGQYDQCYNVLKEHKHYIETKLAEMTESLERMNYKLENYQQIIQTSMITEENTNE
ncbi:MerR family transcriptional regulator [Paenibacillus qinlingensis]|uniref:DNA-binding transcriptional MerR regulator n=1 Tax=Paenibacillus qinlingensis TaxID=1837343 RepID=A0ABU1P6V9_9BACL|nr:MerR family transcriptional regulator [Paenibacillus qinlingensis]MDR6555066.1 DNA-binding transcriptional MerR regulator [Paenibacillus qinlingensis]